jgi:hypothetical protein
MGGARKYTFTYFPADPKTSAPKFDPSWQKYLIFQLEKCPTTSRLHYQGFVWLKDKLSKKKIVQWLRKPDDPTGAHVEEARDVQASIMYCKKTATRFVTQEDGWILGPQEFGKPEKEQGKRTDLQELAAMVKEGATNLQIATANPVAFLKNARGLEALRSAVSKPENADARLYNVIVAYGATAQGKTLWVHDTFGDKMYTAPSVAGQTQWFDGYDGEEVILFDDYTGGIEMGFFLRLLDVYQMKLPVKGAYTAKRWNTVVITSNFPPEQWYRKDNCTHPQLPALMRRITCLLNFNERPYTRGCANPPLLTLRTVEEPITPTMRKTYEDYGVPLPVFNPQPVEGFLAPPIASPLEEEGGGDDGIMMLDGGDEPLQSLMALEPEQASFDPYFVPPTPSPPSSPSLLSGNLFNNFQVIDGVSYPLDSQYDPGFNPSVQGHNSSRWFPDY